MGINHDVRGASVDLGIRTPGLVLDISVISQISTQNSPWWPSAGLRSLPPKGGKLVKGNSFIVIMENYKMNQEHFVGLVSNCA